MKNEKFGRVGAIVTGLNVSVFALDMIARLIIGYKTVMVSYIVCIFIAVGFIMLSVSFTSIQKDRQYTAVGYAGIAFAVVYALLIFIVYYAMLTTVRMNDALSNEALSILSYEHLGSLFFNYDLLGYGFMGLSTFFTGFTITGKTKSIKALRLLLWIHGIFFISCFVMPMFPVFTADMQGGEIIGTVVLLIWCVYFLPICILSWKYFKKK